MRQERLKHVADIRVSNVDKKSAEDGLPVWLCNYTDVYYSESITGSIKFMEATATPSQKATFGLQRGDVVLTKDSETPDDIGVSAFVAEDVPDLVCGYHLAVVRAHGDRTVGGYLRWALASTAVRQRMSAVATGVTRFGLRSDAIADLLVPLPSIPVQEAIADYLDTETTRIDALIETERRRLSVANERLASATQALVLGRADSSLCVNETLGPLNPVPAEWEMRRNKTFMREIVDLSTRGDEELLTVSHITGVSPRSEKDVTMFLAESNEGYKRVMPGDLVVNTMWAWMGALGVSEYEGIVSPAYGVYRFSDESVSGAYFDALFRSPAYVAEMTRYSKGVWTSRLRLYPESFLTLRSPFPPRHKQHQIADRIG